MSKLKCTKCKNSYFNIRGVVRELHRFGTTFDIICRMCNKEYTVQPAHFEITFEHNWGETTRVTPFTIELLGVDFID